VNPAIAILGIFLLAALAEALVEYFVAPWLKPEGKEFDEPQKTIRTMLLRYSSAAVGVGLCLAYTVDLLAIVGLESGWWWVGPFLTGLLIGRGANFVNDFVERWVRPIAEAK